VGFVQWYRYRYRKAGSRKKEEGRRKKERKKERKKLMSKHSGDGGTVDQLNFPSISGRKEKQKLPKTGILSWFGYLI